MSLKTITSFPSTVKETENLFIALSDGTKLAARLWMPADALKKPVPALLDYSPLAKRHGTSVRDGLNHPWFAGFGYACLRVDLRGTGDSDGVRMLDGPSGEIADALEVIAWAAAQKWCSGAVGIMGIGEGGTRALQVAAARPPALKAVVSLSPGDDSDSDGPHEACGCVRPHMLNEACIALAQSVCPPDPLLAGRTWKKMWMQRLEAAAIPAVGRLSHALPPTRGKTDPKPGAIQAIEAPCLLVGGWNDVSPNAIPHLMRTLKATSHAIVGPWANGFPHLDGPEPRIGILQEMLRWWDYWLKNLPTNSMADSPWRYYIMDCVRPSPARHDMPGRWVSDHVWQGYRVRPLKLSLSASGLGAPTGPAGTDDLPITFTSPQDRGAASGDRFILPGSAGFSSDQARDDAVALCFDSPALLEDLDLVGQPLLELELSADQPVAFVVAELCDVWPTGEVTRISRGVCNLTRAQKDTSPQGLEPGVKIQASIPLDAVAWRVPQGHRLRIALAPTSWPLLWPAPVPVTLTVHAGLSHLAIPVREASPSDQTPEWRPPEAATPAPVRTIEAPEHRRESTLDPRTGETCLLIVENHGRHEISPHKLIAGHRTETEYRIHPDDPLSARVKTSLSQELKRGRWQTRTQIDLHMHATATHWVVKGKLEAFEGKAKIFTRSFNHRIKRHFN